jgi:predicted enzyme related to lactoylglutathione lyase
MITGAHAVIFASDADGVRDFFKNVLEMDYVDAGGGWLIFKLPPAELGIHPTDEHSGPSHLLYLTCDNLDATMKDLAAKGVTFNGDVQDQGWGRLVTFNMPGGAELAMYEPRHAQPES